MAQTTSEDKGNELFYEQMITVFRPYIEEEMKASIVLLYLPTLTRNREIVKEIMSKEKISSTEANKCLIEKMMERRETGWYQEFVDVLRESDFEKLADRLDCKEVKDDEVFKEIVRKHLKVLSRVKPMPVMVELVTAGIINTLDQEEVCCIERTRSTTAAMIDLIFRMSKKKEDWFFNFIKSLKATNEREALQHLHPLLPRAGSDSSLEAILDQMASDFIEGKDISGLQDDLDSSLPESLKQDDCFQKIVHLHLPVLIHVNPEPILYELLVDNRINQREFEEVMNLKELESSHRAMMELLYRLLPRKENWFKFFVEVLKKNNERQALAALDPDFYFASEDIEKEKKIEDNCSSEELLLTKNVDELGIDFSKDLNSMEAAEICEELKFVQPKSSSVDLKVDAANILYNDDESCQKKSMSGEKGRTIGTAAIFMKSGSGSIENQKRETSLKQTVGTSGDRGLVCLETQIKHNVSSGVVSIVPSSSRSPERQPAPTEVQMDYQLQLNVNNAENCNNSSSPLQISSTMNGLEEIQGVSISLMSDHDLEEQDLASPVECDGVSCSNNNCNLHNLALRTNDISNLGSIQKAPTLPLRDAQPDSDLRTLVPEDGEKRPVPNRIFVSGLGSDVKVEDLVEHFEVLGMDCIRKKKSKSNEYLIKLYRDKETKIPTGEALISFVDANHANAAVEIFNEQPFRDKPSINVEIAWERVKPSMHQDSNASTESSTLTAKQEELKLRSYQAELTEKASKGQNCIIVAPTGSGKTHVAMAIVKNHIENAKLARRHYKVVFFVPTVALVEQQRRQFETYLHPDFKILGISGEINVQLPLSELIPKQDIIVMTPQIIENSLRVGELPSLSVLTLIIFDECHHTGKGHPYNLIMSHYLDEMFDKKDPSLPQVVGLTASVGVGKSKSMEQSMNYILKLCANLDARDICTVQKNIKELMEHVNKPDEQTKELTGRRNDPFNKTISEIMKTIEEKMQHSEAASNEEFRKNLLAPADRGGDPYTQWLSRLRNMAPVMEPQEMKKFFVSCLEYLRIYNIALLINADCRTKDALEFIVKELNPAKLESPELEQKFDDNDTWLKKLFDDQKNYLQQVSQDPNNENPKLNYLKNMILEFYDNAPDSRCIIFCKTREMTLALMNWMKETDGLKKLNPHNLVGTNAPANQAGMTTFQQTDVLKFFKQGNHKIIVATSVAEEGLDVQKCNIVIRYEHVTNSIARVQTRGRARAEQAKCVLVAEKGRGAAMKEECNAIRENMMQKAIKMINDLKSNDRQEKIRRYQVEARVERQMAKKGKEINKKLKKGRRSDERSYVVTCFKCSQFAAMSEDIRKIESSHHVVLDKTYKERIIIRPHPAPKHFENFELTGKIYCNKCNQDWGIQALYKKVPFPVMKITSFVFEDERTKMKTTYKRWKEVPFEVPTLTVEDLTSMANQDDADETPVDDDNGSDSDDEDDRIFDSFESDTDESTMTFTTNDSVN